MGSQTQWTDKSAIMRDLSFAQGRWVPGGIESAIAGGKPPIHNISEETEEEYFKRWTTDGDFSAGADLTLITQMLEMVHGEEPEPDYSQPGQMEIKKLNPIATVFVPKFKKNAAKPLIGKIEVKPVKEKTQKKIKPLRQRNVAIASIIANFSDISEDIEEIPIKLAKPEDFIKSPIPEKIDKEEMNSFKRQNDSVNKVNSWLQSQVTNSMFKKKTSTKSVNEVTNKHKTESLKSPVQSDMSEKSPQNIGQHFVPSSWAKDYYKKCVDRTHIRDMVQETVWARAEKIMKEIDTKKAEEQRKQEEADAVLAAEIAAAEEESLKHIYSTEKRNDADSDADDDETENCDKRPASETKGIATVLLPRHRHLLTGDCIVCKVLAKKETENKVLNDTENNEDQMKPREVGDEIPVVSEGIENADETQEEQLFCLVRSRFVENLTDLTEEFKNMQLDDSGSSEVQDSLPDS